MYVYVYTAVCTMYMEVRTSMNADNRIVERVCFHHRHSSMVGQGEAVDVSAVDFFTPMWQQYIHGEISRDYVGAVVPCTWLE